MDDKKLELQRMLNALDPERLSKEDFVTAFERVMEYLQEQGSSVIEAVEQIRTALAEETAANSEKTNSEFGSLRDQSVAILRATVSALETRSNELLERLEGRLAAIKDGQDADPEAVTQEVLKRIVVPTPEDVINGLPALGERVRDSLELLPEKEKLMIDAIEGLREELDELKKKAKSFGGGGSMGLSVGHWPLHESFTMDGVATTVTLTQGGVGAAGTACIVRYQGQTLDLTTHYTVSGNKITLVDFTPIADSIISVTYWP